MAKASAFRTSLLLAAFVITLAATAAHAHPYLAGDWVWYDTNGNGLQDEDPSTGINGVQVVVYRDYGCDGSVDVDDEVTGYSFTDNGPNGNPGWYNVEVFGSIECNPGWCYVAEVQTDTLPDTTLIATTPTSHPFEILCGDYFDADFGFSVDTPPPPPPPVCGECEGKITELTIKYLGDTPAHIEVVQKKPKETIFDGTVGPGELFSFAGVDKKGTMSTEIQFFVDGEEDVKVHTSCSKPIGPGLVFGDFEVVAGTSRKGGALCPQEPIEPPSPTCGCEGKVSELTLMYLGEEPALVEVEQKHGEVLVFADTVDPGQTFAFVGEDKKGTLGTEIRVYVDGDLNAAIHTSCSRPIGPGLIAGDFLVVDGQSRRGGALCPVDGEAGGAGEEPID